MKPTVRLIQGDCLEVLKTLDAGSIDAVITDPPYGESMGFNGDEDISTAVELLSAASAQWRRVLKPCGFAAVFWASRSVDMAMDALRDSGLGFCRILNMYLPRGGARPYRAWLPRTQPILLFQKQTPSELHAQISAVLRRRMEDLGHTNSSLSRLLGCDSRLVMKWTREKDPAWCLPTPRFYSQLKSILQVPDEFDFFLERQPANGGRDDYEYRHDTYIVESQDAGCMAHPCQKPLAVVGHLVRSLTTEGCTVLDSFMGSGTSGVASVQADRNFIGVECDPKYFATAERRIADATNTLF